MYQQLRTSQKLCLSSRKKNKNADLNLNEWFNHTIPPNVSNKSFSSIKETSLPVKPIPKNPNSTNSIPKHTSLKKPNKLHLNVNPIQQNISLKQTTKPPLIIKNNNSLNKSSIISSSRNINNNNINNNKSLINKPNEQKNKFNITIYHKLRAISCNSNKYIPRKQYAKRRSVIKNKISILNNNSIKHNKSANNINIYKRNTKISPMNISYVLNDVTYKNELISNKQNPFLNNNSTSFLLIKHPYSTKPLLKCNNNNINNYSIYNQNINSSHQYMNILNTNIVNDISIHPKHKLKLKTILYRNLH